MAEEVRRWNILVVKPRCVQCAFCLRLRIFALYLLIRMSIFIYCLRSTNGQEKENQLFGTYSNCKTAFRRIIEGEMKMPCKATLADLVESLAENMSVVELAQTAIRVEISKTIREARKQLNLSQKELAEKMGVKQSMVSRWESGECNYTIDTLVQIANALNLSVECPLVFEEVSVPVNSVSVRPQSAHTIVSENTEFSNVIRLDFGKVTNGGAA